MPADPYQLFNPDGSLNRREFERMGANVYALGRPAFGPGVRGHASILGQSVQATKKVELWAQITGKDTSTPPRYRYIEARPIAPGRFSLLDVGNGWKDTDGSFPAMESTGNASVPVDGSVFVRMQLADSGDHFVFTYSGGSSFTQAGCYIYGGMTLTSAPGGLVGAGTDLDWGNTPTIKQFGGTFWSGTGTRPIKIPVTGWYLVGLWWNFGPEGSGWPSNSFLNWTLEGVPVAGAAVETALYTPNGLTTFVLAGSMTDGPVFLTQGSPVWALFTSSAPAGYTAAAQFTIWAIRVG